MEEIIRLAPNIEVDMSFLQDGAWCEHAYIYNRENDTLEIYRGLFKIKQSFDIKESIINSLNEKSKYYSHLIIIIDRKKHTKKQVLKAFLEYDDSEEEGQRDYPERDVIPLELNDDYTLLV